MFNIYKIEELIKRSSFNYYREDVFKISLITKGLRTISNSEKSYTINDIPVLILSSSKIPYSYNFKNRSQEGYICLFTEGFINEYLIKANLLPQIFSKVDFNEIIYPDYHSTQFLANIFDRMVTELESKTPVDYHLLQNCIQLIVHEGLNIVQEVSSDQPTRNSEELSSLFINLLNRQFPVLIDYNPIKLKRPIDYAQHLSVRTKILNHAVKTNTGKTTQEHIVERVIQEAKSLLTCNNWDISRIGYCLGYEYGSSFNVFFKKHTGETPGIYRSKNMDVQSK